MNGQNLVGQKDLIGWLQWTGCSGTKRLNGFVLVEPIGLDVNGYSGIKRLNVLVMGEEAQCTGYSKKEKQKGLIMAKRTSYSGTERLNGLIIVGPGD